LTVFPAPPYHDSLVLPKLPCGCAALSGYLIRNTLFPSFVTHEPCGRMFDVSEMERSQAT
jgi:hypothetical protein